MTDIIRKKRSARITMNTFPESKIALKGLADAHDLPLATFLRMLVNDYMKEHGLRRVGDQIVKRAA